MLLVVYQAESGQPLPVTGAVSAVPIQVATLRVLPTPEWAEPVDYGRPNPIWVKGWRLPGGRVQAEFGPLPEQAHAGGVISLPILWTLLGEPKGEPIAFVNWVQDGRVVASQQMAPFPAEIDMNIGADLGAVLSLAELRVPDTLSAGLYGVHLLLFDQGEQRFASRTIGALPLPDRDWKLGNVLVD